MSASDATLFHTRGKCLCGAVTFTVTLKNQHIDACHCDMCRTWSAGPFMAVECDRPPQIDDQSVLGVYQSSEWAERVFCKTCGTSLFYRLIGRDQVAVAADVLELSDEAEFTLQIFTDEKPAYYAFANKTKMMTGQQCVDAYHAGQER